MEMINSSPAGAEAPKKLQQVLIENRLAYLGQLKGEIDIKMDQLTEEAEAGIEGEETLQKWFADQIFESANILSLQFTQATLSRAWQRVTSYKFEQLKSMLHPEGRTAEIRAELREAAEQVLAPLDGIESDMARLWGRISEQNIALTKLCKRNGFTSTQNRELYTMYDIGQINAVDSVRGICSTEIQHIEKTANLFTKVGYFEDVVLRHSPFFGGKFTQVVECFPQSSLFEGKRREEFKNFGLARLEWRTGAYIESLRFTMSNGEKSERFGDRAFTSGCDFLNPVTRIEATYRERGLVSLTFHSASEVMTIAGTGEGKHSDKVDVIPAENLAQFRVRLAQGVIQGISFGVISSKAQVQIQEMRAQQ